MNQDKEELDEKKDIQELYEKTQQQNHILRFLVDN